MNLLEAIIAKIDSGEVPAFGGDPGDSPYPYVTVDILSGTAGDATVGPDSSHTESFMFQVTVSSLDPVEAESIGVPIEANLHPDSGPIVWDEGRPGREITRWRTDTRQRYQTEAAPGGATIYYYEVDITMLIQR